MEPSKRCMCGERFARGKGYNAYLTDRTTVKDEFCSSKCARKYEYINMCDTVRPIVEKLTDLCNSNKVELIAEALGAEIKHTHRFLQAQLINSLAMFMGEYAKNLDEEFFDARNEAACHQAKRMNEAAYKFD